MCQQQHDTRWRAVFGGEQVLVTYEQMGHGTGEGAEQIMWGQVESSEGFRIMAFDVLDSRPYDQGANAFLVSVKGSSPAEMRARWDALSEGATILHPLGQGPWSLLYGMSTDRFNVTWTIDVEPAQAE